MLRIHILHHPVAADVILVSATDAEDAALIRDDSAAELGYVEVVLQVDLVRDHLVDVEEVDVL